MGNRALPEESHINPITGLGGSNTEESLLNKQHTSLGNTNANKLVKNDKEITRQSLSKTSGTAEVNWIAKQLEMMERRDNMKNEAPIKVCSVISSHLLSSADHSHRLVSLLFCRGCDLTFFGLITTAR